MENTAKQILQRKNCGNWSKKDSRKQFISILFFDALTRAQTNDELSAIRAELAEQGYLRKKGPAPKKGKETKLAPKRYRSDDGFLILVGRNNVQNDQLTLKDARGRDVWIPTKIIRALIPSW